VRAYIKREFSLSVGQTAVWLHRPDHVVNGKVNTCACLYCENICLLKQAVMHNAEVLRRPTLTVKAWYTLLMVLTAWVYKWRISQRGRSQLQRMAGRSLFCLCWVAAEILHCRIFPTLDIVDTCRGAFKAEILERLLCRGALPAYVHLTRADCGCPQCFDQCTLEQRCPSCIGGAEGVFQKLLLVDRVPDKDLVAIAQLRKLAWDRRRQACEADVPWGEDDRVQYRTGVERDEAEKGSKTNITPHIWR
jgi:hypothetical protein